MTTEQTKAKKPNTTRFGFAWNRYPDFAPAYEAQFLSWVAPIEKKDFQGQRILDAGCGTGRNAYWALTYGAARVVAFDLDDRVVEVARKNLREHAQAEVVQASIYDIPFENEFDLVFSIGVVHHLDDPNRAMVQLVKAVQPGGKVLLWVYAREGHTALKHFINAIRRVTCKLPLPFLHVLTYPLSVVAYAYLKLGRHDHPYLRLFRNAPFWHVHSILFDQLLPEVSNYWTRDQALALFDDLPVEDVNIRFTNEGSWTLWATKKAPVDV